MRVRIKKRSLIQKELERYLADNPLDFSKELHEQVSVSPGSSFPDLFKHMTLAIMRKGPRSAGWFESALAIAWDFLVKFGYLTPRSNLQRMTLTAKGRIANARHMNEGSAGRKKSELFDRYIARYI